MSKKPEPRSIQLCKKGPAEPPIINGGIVWISAVEMLDNISCIEYPTNWWIRIPQGYTGYIHHRPGYELIPPTTMVLEPGDHLIHPIYTVPYLLTSPGDRELPPKDRICAVTVAKDTCGFRIVPEWEVEKMSDFLLSEANARTGKKKKTASRKKGDR